MKLMLKIFAVPDNPKEHKMWLPTGKDSLREEQARVMREVKRVEEKSRTIHIERSPSPSEEAAVLDRRTGFFTRPSSQQTAAEEDRRVIRRVDRTPTLSPSPERGRGHDRDYRRSSGGGRDSRNISGEKYSFISNTSLSKCCIAPETNEMNSRLQ